MLHKQVYLLYTQIVQEKYQKLFFKHHWVQSIRIVILIIINFHIVFRHIFTMFFDIFLNENLRKSQCWLLKVATDPKMNFCFIGIIDVVAFLVNYKRGVFCLRTFLSCIWVYCRICLLLYYKKVQMWIVDNMQPALPPKGDYIQNNGTCKNLYIVQFYKKKFNKFQWLYVSIYVYI